METKKNYGFVDLTKFIFSFFIVMIHINIFSDINDSLNYFVTNIITRVAVPFFFAVSGFFFAKAMDFNKNGQVSENKSNFKRFRKTEWRIIVLYAVWTVIYLFWSMPMIYGGWSFQSLFDYALTSVVKCSFYHLWYVYALVFAYPVMYVMMRFFPKKAVDVICVALYLAGVFVNSYSYLFDLPAMSSLVEGINEFSFSHLLTNITFRALPLMWIGVSVAKARKKPKKYVCLPVSVICFVLLIAENLWLNNATEGKIAGHYIIFTVLFIYFFFMFAIQCKIKLKKEICVRLRKMSTLIYCLHAMIYLVFSDLLMLDINSIFMFLITSAVTVAISAVVVILSENKKLKILKYLY